jgi:hypothetical protein
MSRGLMLDCPKPLPCKVLSLILFCPLEQNNMSVFTPGTGGTVVSTTWEAVSIELAELLQGYEEDANALLTNAVNRVAVNYDSGNPKIAQIQINMPITLGIGTDGAPKYVAAPFVSPAPAYVVGAGNDLKSANLEAATFEAFSKLQQLEKATPPLGVAAPANNVTITVNTETLIASIVANLPIDFTIVSGKPTVNAVPYL